ncbi:4-hydroxy-tetrahydrodipicolinate reductase [Clostridium drakei]|uniref:4-hydroxy-tetrahydrodipicolinate reductase n=1 Tax=Clostridium drakei TaxID=332101 RepID=A0A2U8DQB5_9CLOT|nr:4-hydroxy-tetrahydrodipicolinate reductase [Clostridium drakei]AWI04943.1 4-hydroxy-tetrahydrodipicolinate reductase [Clostridium drakei]
MNIIVTGPKGKMGKLIIKIANEMNELNIVGALAPKGRDYIGKDVGVVSAIGIEVGAVVVDNLESIINKTDVIIDYTTPECSMSIMEKALEYKKAVVCGTTGFSKEQYNRIVEISKSIPVVFAANTSMVVNLMYKLLKISTETIGNMSDIEIVEMHDRYKKDAPSGTSKEMGEIIAEALGKNLSDIAVFGREGEGARKEGTIGYHSLRAGDISSSHTVMFGLMGERLEITHHAHNWECFANGACKAALFLKEKAPGFYTVKDVLGL